MELGYQEHHQFGEVMYWTLQFQIVTTLHRVHQTFEEMENKTSSFSTDCDDGNNNSADGCSSVCSIEQGWTCSGGTATTKDVCVDICGDGKKYTIISSYCDDGNKVSGDGCSSTCVKETGWTCSGGTTTSKDYCYDICGDGRKYTTLSTFCDDGNTVSGDGCSSTCVKETGWACSGGSSTSSDVCTDICGDGKKYTSLSTFCDDANLVSGDGCSSTCSIESGWTCAGGSSTTKDTCTEICGDGKRFNLITTYCDDGNSVSGDGCSSTCAKESGWLCSGGSTTTKDVCTEICGDGKNFNSLATYCDDGNNLNGDGCNLSCAVEFGWTCTGGNSITKDTCNEICGDGIRFNILSTYCDDGNSVSGDGCSSSCSIESGWLCSGGSTTTKNICTEICGDSKRFNSLTSYCDDGNLIGGDGCNSGCSVESGWTCSGGNSVTKDTCSEICGDGIRFNTVSTYCDDANTIAGDGCNNLCTIESGWICTGGSTSSKDTCSEVCGDGKRFNSLSTYCDDGNFNNGDGCTSGCSIESGWSCSGGTTSAKDTCTEICGDGKRFNSVTTYCDDGNKVNGDGCSSICAVEAGYVCSGGTSSTVDTCSEKCGDGIRFNTVSSYCDDSNEANGDGCSSTCGIESGWSCSGGSSTTKDICIEVCGDGKRFNSAITYCDDGNKINSDGCSSSCAIESGWTCSGGSSITKDICSEICGDGKKFNAISTYCDDGNTNSGDGCSSICSVEAHYTCSGGNSSTKDTCSEICGDGVRFNSISTNCDDNNAINGDGCNSACSIESGWTCSGGSLSTKDTCSEICGDGKRFNSMSTYCDDGNSINNDGCNSSCGVESGWTCSGGNTKTKDTCTEICADGKRFNSVSTYCDDGNSLNGDGCSSSCGIESGWTCSGGTTSSKDTCVEACGDGKKFNAISTYCDDGNNISNDGCNSSCTTETGWSCSGGTFTTKDTCTEICGDGKRFNSIDSYCDDGNAIVGDGCNASCNVESGYECKGGSSAAKDICLLIAKDPSQSGVASSLAIQAATGIGICLSAGSSLISMSSPAAIFIMINQFQMLLLLPLTGAYISDQVLFTITGMSMALFSFDFLKLEKISIFYYLFDFLKIIQLNKNLTEIGINSGNTIINCFKLFCIIVIFILLQLVFIPINLKCRKSVKSKYCIKLNNFLFKFMTFSIYIRLLLQAYIMILLSSLSQIVDFEHSGFVEIISLIIAIIIFNLAIVYLCFCLTQVFKVKRLYQPNYYDEFFNGLKDNLKSRLYPAIFMLQRIMSSVILIVFMNIKYEIKLSLFAAVQVIIAVYLILVRPYALVKDLIMEVYSQIIFSVLSCLLIYFKSESEWNTLINWIFMTPIMFSSLLSTIISLIDLGIKIKNKIKEYCGKCKRVDNYKSSANKTQDLSDIKTKQITKVSDLSRNEESEFSRKSSNSIPSFLRFSPNRNEEDAEFDFRIRRTRLGHYHN